VGCYRALQYPHKLACVASEFQACRCYVRQHFPFIQALGFEVWRPPFTKERIYAIAQARETIRRHVCEDPRVQWLLFIDIDLCYPPDTIERMLQWAGQGFDLVFSRTPGLISLMHRDVCQSVSFVTGVNFRNPASTLEEHYQVERQLEVFNSVRPGRPFFRVKPFRADWLQHRDKPVGVYP
jgi:hypothetical protein